MDFTYLQEHLDELVSQMRARNYAETTISGYRRMISRIATNADDHSWDSYIDIYFWYASQSYKDCTLRDIRTVLGKLEYFHLCGTLPDAKSSINPFWKRKAAYHQLSSEYQGLVDYYCQVEKRRGLKETTIYSGAHKTASFLLALQSKGEDSLEKVTEDSVLSCFSDCGEMIRGASCSHTITRFFRVCTPLNPTECQRIIRCIPALRSARKNIAYLSKEECAKIRAALDDQSNSLLYRDRAIGMLLLYTGMRGVDIANLLLTSIDLEKDKIYLVQQKTQKPQELPLSSLVGNAICEYCVYERPKIDNPYLFLTCFAPYHSLTAKGMQPVVRRIMDKANVRQYSDARKGTHIFRHHLATTLLENGISQPIISSALGHNAPASLEPYLYADMVHLRKCALSVEQYAISEGVFSHA